MKKIILTTLALSLGVVFGYSQGTVTINNTTSTFFISTNNGVSSGVTRGASGNFYYTVLTTAYTGSAPATSLAALINSSIWTWTGVTGSQNALTAGGITANTSQAATGWSLPATGLYSGGPTNYYTIVGWSSVEGTSWLSVSNLIATTGLTTGGYFGLSSVAFQVAGGANSLNAVSLFGDPTLIAGAGLSSGFQLNIVSSAVPEPSTMALAALGGASLLLFRRRKV